MGEERTSEGKGEGRERGKRKGKVIWKEGR